MSFTHPTSALLLSSAGGVPECSDHCSEFRSNSTSSSSLTAGFLRIEMRISTWQTVNTCTVGQSRFCHLRSKAMKKEGRLHTAEKQRLHRKMAKHVKWDKHSPDMPQYLHGWKPVELKSRERMVRCWWGTCGREPAERETEHHLGIFDCCTIVVVTQSLARFISLSRAKGMTNHGWEIKKVFSW